MTKEKLILALQEAFAAGEEYGRDDGQGLVGSKSGEDAWDDFVKYWSDIDAANILSILSTATEELDAAKAGLVDADHVYLVYNMKQEDPEWICTSEEDAEHFVAKGRAENDCVDYGWNKETISRPDQKQV